MNKLIEDYLRSRGVRFFRGHHDDEFFYFVDVPVSAVRARRAGRADRLNVHLEVSGPGRDAVRVGISQDRFYPVDRRDRLCAVAARWNAGDPSVRAVVHDSSDPTLVGVGAQITHRPVDMAGLADFVDQAVESSVELFGLMRDVSPPESRSAAVLRDAG